MVHTVRLGAGKAAARDRASQVVVGVSVAAGKVWAGELENGLDLSSAGVPCDSNCLAIQKSTMLQSGCGKRSAIRHRCIQA